MDRPVNEVIKELAPYTKKIRVGSNWFGFQEYHLELRNGKFLLGLDILIKDKETLQQQLNDTTRVVLIKYGEYFYVNQEKICISEKIGERIKIVPPE